MNGHRASDSGSPAGHRGHDAEDRQADDLLDFFNAVHPAIATFTKQCEPCSQQSTCNNRDR